MRAHLVNDQSDVKGPIISKTSLQTYGKVLNFQCLDSNLSQGENERKNVLVVRKETFTRNKTPSCV